MTGIHHLAPATHLHATRHIADAHAHHALVVRRPGRIRTLVRGVADALRAEDLPRWVDTTPASVAR